LNIKTALLITLIILLNNKRNNAKYTQPILSFSKLGAGALTTRTKVKLCKIGKSYKLCWGEKREASTLSLWHFKRWHT